MHRKLNNEKLALTLDWYGAAGALARSGGVVWASAFKLRTANLAADATLGAGVTRAQVLPFRKRSFALAAAAVTANEIPSLFTGVQMPGLFV